VIIPSSFAPIGVLQVELSAPLADLQPAAAASGEAFGSARVFARLHGRPLGFVEVPLIEPLPAAQLASAMARTLGGSIARHLADDGLDESLVDLENGVGSVDRPLCLEPQRALLVDPRFVSVVVPTVDRPGALRQCLQGLAEQTYPSFEVLVVDNDPDASGAAEVVSGFERQVPGLRRIAELRRGASRARNRGFAEAAGEIVAFLDGDARPDPSWLAAAVAALVRPANLGSATCVTGAILPAALETEAQLWMEEWGGYSKGFEPRRFDLGAHRPAGPLFPYAIATCGSGASMVLRRSELRALGGFAPALGAIRRGPRPVPRHHRERRHDRLRAERDRVAPASGNGGSLPGNDAGLRGRAERLHRAPRRPPSLRVAPDRGSVARRRGVLRARRLAAQPPSVADVPALDLARGARRNGAGAVCLRPRARSPPR
jgi:hypothetical protein